MLAFIDPESRIPANHPLRTIKQLADAALAELSPQFDRLYAADGKGRPSIPPERLLKASLLSHPLSPVAAVRVATRPIAGWTSAARSVRMPRTRAAPIQMLGCIRKVPGRLPGCATSGTR